MTDAADVIAEAVSKHHPRLVMLCSFQKEESVLVDELVRLAPDARIVTIDTGVLFPETLSTWRAFEERFGIDVAVEEAYGDWSDVVETATEALADMRDRFARTLGEDAAETYEDAFNRAVRKRWPELGLEIENR